MWFHVGWPGQSAENFHLALNNFFKMKSSTSFQFLTSLDTLYYACAVFCSHVTVFDWSFLQYSKFLLRLSGAVLTF